MGQKSRFGVSRRGFSVIELLVVVSIIALLAAVGVTVAVSMNTEARRVQTRAMLNGLKGAQEEFVAKRQQGRLNHSGVYPINWSTLPGNPSLSSSERFVYGCSQIKTVEEMMLAALRSGPEASFKVIFKDGTPANGYNGIYDRWGTEIEYRSANPGTGTGPKTGVPDSKLPQTASPLFVSAGPDKAFGTDDDIHTEQSN